MNICLENDKFEPMTEDEMILSEGGLLAGAIFGGIVGLGSGLVKQCVKVVACNVFGYDGWGSSFSLAGVAISTVSGIVKGAVSPF